MKLKSMAFDELVVMRAQIDAEIETRISKQRMRLIEAIAELRGTVPGKNGAGRRGRAHPLKGRELPPLYRNPKNGSETWAGRGNRPRWLAAALKSGKKLESFLIRKN
jgi:DNA-binding protein H-NS